MTDTVVKDVRLIKKYPNRRLYDTRTSSYITVGDVKELVLGHEKFQVVDAKTGDDITRSVLLQIILEEETGGLPMFSSEMLSQIIRFYGHAMQGIMGAYLEKNMQAFQEIQDRIGEKSQGMQFGPEAWTQFMNMQSPVLQNIMNNYVEQSKNMFVQMQDQMQDQTRAMFGGFPFAAKDPLKGSDES